MINPSNYSNYNSQNYLTIPIERQEVIPQRSTLPSQHSNLSLLTSSQSSCCSRLRTAWNSLINRLNGLKNWIIQSFQRIFGREQATPPAPIQTPPAPIAPPDREDPLPDDDCTPSRRLRQQIDSAGPISPDALITTSSLDTPQATEIMRDLIARGLDVNGTDDRIPLISVASRRYAHRNFVLPQIDLLIRSGADVNRTNSRGRTALHCATSWECFPSQYTGALERLIEEGIDVNAQDENGQTALHLAYQNSHEDDRVINLLLQHGARDDILDHQGRRPSELHHQPTQQNQVAPIQNRGVADLSRLLADACGQNAPIERLRELIDQGADVNANIDGRGFPLLNLLHYYRDPTLVEKVRLLLDAGANPNAADDEGRSALYSACTFSYSSPQAFADAIDLLIERGANPTTAINTTHITPLHMAVQTANYPPSDQILRALIQGGADPNALTITQSTPLHHCYQWLQDPRREAVRAILVQNGAREDILDANGQRPDQVPPFVLHAD